MDSETKKLLIARKHEMKQVKSIGTMLWVTGGLGIVIDAVYNALMQAPLWDWKMGIGIGLIVVGFIMDGLAEAEIVAIEQKLSE